MSFIAVKFCHETKAVERNEIENLTSIIIS